LGALQVPEMAVESEEDVIVIKEIIHGVESVLALICFLLLGTVLAIYERAKALLKFVLWGELS